MEIKGNVFNVQRFTIHDGPGIRTEFFLKGCPLRCRWCSNPESQKAGIQVGVYRKKCIGMKQCGDCAAVCPTQSLGVYRNKVVLVNYDTCRSCMSCVNECPSDALKQWGKMMTVDECMKTILADRGFYERSGGGVTVSGGDPLIQADFVAELFKACRAEGIHTCFESTFHGSWAQIEKILPVSDLLISDLKLMDPALHKEWTGVSNDLILENLRRLARTDKELILRIPVIPGVNDNMENMEATADFITNDMAGRVRTLQLLSFMRLGEEKYASLHMDYPMDGVKVNRKSFQKKIEKFADYFNERGIHCLVGTKEKQ